MAETESGLPKSAATTDAPVADPIEVFRERRDVIRRELGGVQRLARLAAEGRMNIREHIAALVDPGSFDEIGTFAHSERHEDQGITPGDGKIAGHALIDGRPVSVCGDDDTVKRASSSVVGSARRHRVYGQALQAGNPFIYLGQTGGARLPDLLGSEGFSKLAPNDLFVDRNRRIPLVSVIVGNSFGGSSFRAATSDLVVQLRDTCMAVTSPLAIEVATGEKVSMADLGGPDVHSKITGQVDVVAQTVDEAYSSVRTFLSYLPSNSWTPPRRSSLDQDLKPDANFSRLVPRARRRAYDMRHVLQRFVDGGQMFEFQPAFGRSLLTVLARVNGFPVGIAASQPLLDAGVLSPSVVEKLVRLFCLCDAFGLPIIFLQDTPGFMIGSAVEHAKFLHRVGVLAKAWSLLAVPTISVVLRKAFGLGYYMLGGNDMGVSYIFAWPHAEMSFMDPDVAANIMFRGQLEKIEDQDERARERQRLAGVVAADTDPYGAAGIMKVDEIIDPDDTRVVVGRALERLSTRPFVPGHLKPLASWPVRL